MATVAITKRNKDRLIASVHGLLLRHVHMQDGRFPFDSDKLYAAVIPHDIRAAVHLIKMFKPKMLNAETELWVGCDYPDRKQVQVGLKLMHERPLPKLVVPLVLDNESELAAPLREWADARQVILDQNDHIAKKLAHVIESSRTGGHIRYLWPELMTVLPNNMRDKLGDTVARYEPSGMWVTVSDTEFYSDYDACNDWLAMSTLMPDNANMSQQRIVNVTRFGLT